MNRKNPSITKYVANQKSEMSAQKKQANNPEINVVKHTVIAKGHWGLRNLGNTSYMKIFFRVLQKKLHHREAVLYSVLGRKGEILKSKCWHC